MSFNFKKRKIIHGKCFEEIVLANKAFTWKDELFCYTKEDGMYITYHYKSGLKGCSSYRLKEVKENTLWNLGEVFGSVDKLYDTVKDILSKFEVDVVINDIDR